VGEVGSTNVIGSSSWCQPGQLQVGCSASRTDIFDAILSPDMGNGLAIGHLLTLQEIEIDMSDFLDHEWHDV
jgi:hypothetical protein